MKYNAVPIDLAGRIVLPKNLRQELAIKPGDTFKVAVQGMAVTLTPIKAGGGFVRKGKALVFATAGEETLDEARVEAIMEAGREDRELGGVAGLRNGKSRG